MLAFRFSHVGLRKCLLIQARDRRVDILHRAAQILDQRAAFPREIVEAGFARPVDRRCSLE